MLINDTLQHIIWLTPGFASDEQDDTCIPPLQLLARSLQAQAGIQLHIIPLHYPQRTTHYTYYGCHVYPSARQGALGKIRTCLYAYQNARILLRNLPNAQLHSFWLNANALIGHWLARQYHLRHTVTLMGQDARGSNKYLRFAPLEELSLVCLSSLHQQTLLRQYPQLDTRLIPWGVPDSEITSKPTDARPYDVVGVGSLIRLKGYDRFLDTIHMLRQQHPGLRCLLIGDGPERMRLEAQVKHLNLSAHVQFTGKIARAEVLAYLAQAKVLLHTSSYESFGYVLLEALAQGAGVVSTPVGIAPELPDVLLGNTPAELSAQLNQILTYKITPSPISSPFRMRDTLQEYLNLYTAS